MHFYFILFVCPVPKVSVQKTSALQQLQLVTPAVQTVRYLKCKQNYHICSQDTITCCVRCDLYQERLLLAVHFATCRHCSVLVMVNKMPCHVRLYTRPEQNLLSCWRLCTLYCAVDVLCPAALFFYFPTTMSKGKTVINNPMQYLKKEDTHQVDKDTHVFLGQPVEKVSWVGGKNFIIVECGDGLDALLQLLQTWLHTFYLGLYEKTNVICESKSLQFLRKRA